ncbi:MAG: RNA polymerase sigma factor [Myxococcota bacterium]
MAIPAIAAGPAWLWPAGWRTPGAGGDAAVSAAEPRDLLERARGGDGAAFAELFSRFERDVARLCHRMLDGTGADAEDAAAEVFLRARRSLSGVDPDRPFRAWLLAVANHHCIDVLRRRLRERRLFVADSGEELPEQDPAPSPLSALLWAERRDELAAAIDALPARYRVPLVLRYFSELDYKAIAEVLDVTPVQVNNWLYRGRRALRESLSGSRSGVGAGR